MSASLRLAGYIRLEKEEVERERRKKYYQVVLCEVLLGRSEDSGHAEMLSRCSQRACSSGTTGRPRSRMRVHACESKAEPDAPHTREEQAVIGVVIDERLRG